MVNLLAESLDELNHHTAEAEMESGDISRHGQSRKNVESAQKTYDTETDEENEYFLDECNNSLGFYISEIGKVPLLTHQQEIDLCKRIERGRVSRKYLAECPQMSDNDRQELIDTIKDGEEARESLITANTRLVLSVAKKYSLGNGFGLEDLVQEGNLGLMRAVQKYDYLRGHRFSTYATWWIRQSITRMIADTAHTIRVPVHTGAQVRKVLVAKTKLEQEKGRALSIQELSQETEIPRGRVLELLEIFAQQPISIDRPLADDKEDSNTLGDYIEDDSTDIEKIIDKRQLAARIDDILIDMDPQAARVIRLRYGLLGGKPLTLDEIGDLEGLSREAIRKIEAKGLVRFRHVPNRRGLREYCV